MKNQEKRHIFNMNWNHSKRGVCYRLWHHNVKNSIKRGHTPPAYTRDQLEKWILEHPNFETLYNTWVTSDYDMNLAVSVDRLDDSKGYSFDNIQLISFEENCKKACEGTRNKTLYNPTLLNGGHRAVTMFTLKGVPLCSHISLAEAARFFNTPSHQSISACCLYQKLYWKNYLWCYSDEFDSFTSSKLSTLSPRAISEYKLKNSRVLQYTLEGEFINEYSTITEAAKCTNLTTNLVKKWIYGRSTKMTPTYIFKLKEIHID